MNNETGQSAIDASGLTPAQERDILANAIREAALKRGLVRGDAPLTGPHLLMLCEDLAQTRDPGSTLINAAQNVEAWITDYVPKDTRGREVELRDLRSALEPHRGARVDPKGASGSRAVAALLHAAQAVQVAIKCGGHRAALERSNPLCVEALDRAIAEMKSA